MACSIDWGIIIPFVVVDSDGWDVDGGATEWRSWNEK